MGGVGEEVWLGGGQGVGREAEGAADGAGSAVAGGEDVYVGVADHDGLSGGDGRVDELTGLGDEGEQAMGIGLFSVEAVASVVLEEEAGEIEVVADGAGGVDRLVGEECDGKSGVSVADKFERVDDTGVEGGEVDFVDAVEVQEKGDCFGYILFVVNVTLGIAEGTADKHGGSVAEVAGDHGFGEKWFIEVGEHGVDGVGEIDSGVDEGTVKVEDEETKGREMRHVAMLAGRDD